MVPELPVEITEATIDRLIADRDVPSLHACSLTCKAWLPKCRSYIFERVILSYRDPGRLYRFLDIAQSPTNPGQYVRVLNIMMGAEYDINRWSGIPALPILAKHLTNLEVLMLGHMGWSGLDPAARTAILSGFNTVTELYLEEPWLTVFARTVDLISSFPMLKTLGYHSLNIQDNSEDLSMEDMKTPPDLQKLVLQGYFGMKQMASWFASTECHIPRVDCQICADEDLVYITNLLKRIGPSLEELEISWYPAAEEVPWENSMDLSKNTALRFLQINCDGMMRVVVDDYLRHLSRILSSVRSVELQRLDLDLWVNNYSREDPVWGNIEEILAHSHFSSLQNVTFQVNTVGLGANHVRNYIKQRMPNLARRNIAKLEYLETAEGDRVFMPL